MLFFSTAHQAFIPLISLFTASHHYSLSPAYMKPSSLSSPFYPLSLLYIKFSLLSLLHTYSSLYSLLFHHTPHPHYSPFLLCLLYIKPQQNSFCAIYPTPLLSISPTTPLLHHKPSSTFSMTAVEIHKMPISKFNQVAWWLSW